MSSKPLPKLIKELEWKKMWLKEQVYEGRKRGVAERKLQLDIAKAESLERLMVKLRKKMQTGQKTITMKRAESLLKDIVHKEMHTQKIWEGM